MKNKLFIFATVFLILFMTSCNRKVIDSIDGGKIVSVTPFLMQMQIETDKNILFVSGNHSVVIGSDTKIQIYENNFIYDSNSCLLVEGKSDCWVIHE